MATDSDKRRQDARYCAEWAQRVGDRFKVGDRVTFSHWADKNGVSWRTKGGVRSGTVEAVSDNFRITVRLDGYKHPSQYHHMFFIPAAEAGH